MAEEGENLMNIWEASEAEAVAAAHSLAARKVREKTPMPRSMQRVLRDGPETKTEQLNVRLTRTVKARIAALAQAERCSVAELIERMAAKYEAAA